LGGRVLVDVSGVPDPTAPLAGWTVYLDQNGNDTADPGEPSTVTNGQGGFAFSGLPSGSYTVREVVPSGWRCTSPSTDPAACELSRTLSAGGSATGLLFANTNSASVSGLVFDDTDRDGVRDVSEQGLVGWTVYVDTDKDNRLDAGEPRTTSDAAGTWRFTLASGSYTIREVVQKGWLCVSTSRKPTACAFAFILTAGQADDIGQDFANRRR
jgi:hypothetical protein